MKFDFIIIGAGSAGCVLANKLSNSKNHNVLLIEAGPNDDSFFIKMPIGYGVTFYNRKINWCYSSEEEKNLCNRKIFWPRGKVIGGSSSINGLVYHRGQASDYDDWEKEGNLGWDYNSLIPFFEEFEQINTERSNLKKDKLSISYVENEYHPIKSIFYKSCLEAGLKVSKNSCLEGEGIGPYFINTVNGLRCSSSKSFLKPILNRKNLKVLKKSLVSKIIIKDKKAIGVKIEKFFAGGKIEKTFFSDNEIILSAGAINSPQILQLSGIGPSNLLKNNGINVILNNPNVGQNLQDHLGISYFFTSKIPSLNQVLGNWKGRIFSGIKYLYDRTGPFSVGVNHIGGLIRTSQALHSSDMQLYMNPHSYQTNFKDKRKLLKPDKFNGFNYSYNSCRPYSKGSIEIISSDINIHPLIKPNYLSHYKDEEDILKMSKIIGKLQHTQSTSEILSEEPNLVLSKMSEEQIINDFKKRSSTVFHPCGTCKMSSKKEQSVVNSDLKLHGIDRLRVVDASVFPNITSANINAPTIMLAHKAAKIILGK